MSSNISEMTIEELKAAWDTTLAFYEAVPLESVKEQLEAIFETMIAKVNATWQTTPEEVKA
jgi:hypothetical protein